MAAPDSLDSKSPHVPLVRGFESYLTTVFTPEAATLLDTFRRWYAALVALPTGHLCLENLAVEYQLSLEDKMALLLDTTVNFLREPHDPRAALSSACRSYMDRGEPVVDEVGELAWFIDFQVARTWLLPTRNSPGLLFSPDGMHWKERLYHNEVVRDPEILSRLRGRIRGSNTITAFSTLASWVHELEREVDSLEELAALVRDKLGLPHLNDACILEIRFPEAAARKGGNQIQKPTFADAGGYPFLLPSQRVDRFGYGRDLSTEEPEKPGGPMVCHAPIDSRLASGLRYLGRPSRELREGRWKRYASKPSVLILGDEFGAKKTPAYEGAWEVTASAKKPGPRWQDLIKVLTHLETASLPQDISPAAWLAAWYQKYRKEKSELCEALADGVICLLYSPDTDAGTLERVLMFVEEAGIEKAARPIRGLVESRTLTKVFGAPSDLHGRALRVLFSLNDLDPVKCFENELNFGDYVPLAFAFVRDRAKDQIPRVLPRIALYSFFREALRTVLFTYPREGVILLGSAARHTLAEGQAQTQAFLAALPHLPLSSRDRENLAMILGNMPVKSALAAPSPPALQFYVPFTTRGEMIDSTNRSNRVFISYAREDRSYAERLYEDLRKTGIEPWLDVRNVLPGQKWKFEISDAIRASDFFLALLSSRSLSKRGYVQKELREALEVLDEMPNRASYLIPVRIDECQPDHPKLLEINWVDLFPIYESGFRRLLLAIKTPRKTM